MLYNQLVSCYNILSVFVIKKIQYYICQKMLHIPDVGVFIGFNLLVIIEFLKNIFSLEFRYCK